MLSRQRGCGCACEHTNHYFNPKNSRGQRLGSALVFGENKLKPQTTYPDKYMRRTLKNWYGSTKSVKRCKYLAKQHQRYATNSTNHKQPSAYNRRFRQTQGLPGKHSSPLSSPGETYSSLACTLLSDRLASPPRHRQPNETVSTTLCASRPSRCNACKIKPGLDTHLSGSVLS